MHALSNCCGWLGTAGFDDSRNRCFELRFSPSLRQADYRSWNFPIGIGKLCLATFPKRKRCGVISTSRGAGCIPRYAAKFSFRTKGRYFCHLKSTRTKPMERLRVENRWQLRWQPRRRSQIRIAILFLVQPHPAMRFPRRKDRWYRPGVDEFHGKPGAQLRCSVMQSSIWRMNLHWIV